MFVIFYFPNILVSNKRAIISSSGISFIQSTIKLVASAFGHGHDIVEKRESRQTWQK